MTIYFIYLCVLVEKTNHTVTTKGHSLVTLVCERFTTKNGFKDVQTCKKKKMKNKSWNDRQVQIGRSSAVGCWPSADHMSERHSHDLIP